jgi:hypothetical protein
MEHSAPERVAAVEVEARKLKEAREARQEQETMEKARGIVRAKLKKHNFGPILPPPRESVCPFAVDAYAQSCARTKAE